MDKAGWGVGGGLEFADHLNINSARPAESDIS